MVSEHVYLLCFVTLPSSVEPPEPSEADEKGFAMCIEEVTSISFPLFTCLFSLANG